MINPVIPTYLGQKGYTIRKNDLSTEMQTKIKKDLLIHPYVHGQPKNSVQNAFPVYRESPNKLYVPHYYGVSQFGPPGKIEIPDGEHIQLSFQGVLRDHQRPVVEKFIQQATAAEVGGGLLELPCAWGKTSASLYICSALQRKTLVIVHKEFLMNQWIERIQQFLPTARIGKIQGKIIDIENKDIVLCMLQSLSMKEYPPTLFESFGLTIIDEVHHISSQTFSCALFKMVTKYMLGLSATMNRKDGTTNVFKMFLGEVIHKEARKEDATVTVKTIEYITHDPEFNETILDYKGNPQISSMISKLCGYSRRTEFIIKVLCDFIRVDGVEESVITAYKSNMDQCIPMCQTCLKTNHYLVINTCCNKVLYCMPCMRAIETDANENVTVSTNESGKTRTTKKRAKCPNCNKILKYEQNYIENPYVKPVSDRQTIILSHNLNVLEYMYTKIVCKNYASVGYYVGGMKEVDLKISETKQVILATFSMAAEALDIPSLNAEFLITPKTDIEQSVGRILRAKHAINHPVIYDIMDSHEVFQKQYLKRKKFYKKQNYKIMETTSLIYNVDPNQWKWAFDPSKSTHLKVTEIVEDEEEDEEENNTKCCMINISDL